MTNISTLKTPTINQNGYHKNILTKERIGTLFIYPTNYTPEDCLSCDGYSLLIIDYEDLFKIIGKQFNQENDPDDTFRVPDYNITGRFLQPGTQVGNLIAAGLPNITGTFTGLFAGFNNVTGAFTGKSGSHSCASGGSSYATTITLQASGSSSIYKNNVKTVQPPSQIVHICIKYK